MTELPYIERYPPKIKMPRSIFNNLDELAEALEQSKGGVGSRVFNSDLSKLDLTCPRGKELLSKISEYDNLTTWPSDLQEIMSERLEAGKNSGLGISSVHKRGYTGKGINIAIIDQALLLEHPEYRDNIRYYKEFGIKEGCEKLGRSYERCPAQYHGPAVASLAVGTNCGSAPDAGLFFVAKYDFDHNEKRETFLDPSNRLKAIRHLIELNRSLPETDKIRAVSCSWGSDTESDFSERMNLFNELEETGCMIFGGFYNCYNQNRRWNYLGGSKVDMTSDAPDNLKPLFACRENTLIVPQNQRTFASYYGGYLYTEQGGSSWTFPYLAGIVACGLQACPNYTKQKDWQDKLWQDLVDTALPTANRQGRIIQPVAFIDRMEGYTKERPVNQPMTALFKRFKDEGRS